MFKDKLNKIIKSDDETNQNKKIENIVFFIVILIITIISINFILNGKKTNTKKKVNNSDNSKVLASTNMEEDKENIEEKDNLTKKLENILSNIQGVGEVKVLLNYSETSEVVAMYNENSKNSTTEETDTNGGIRKITQSDTQKDIIYEEQGGIKKPMTKKLIKPKIEGAIITAKGAANINTKTSIIQAVEAVTGLVTHKIQVFEMK